MSGSGEIISIKIGADHPRRRRAKSNGKKADQRQPPEAGRLPIDIDQRLFHTFHDERPRQFNGQNSGKFRCGNTAPMQCWRIISGRCCTSVAEAGVGNKPEVVPYVLAAMVLVYYHRSR